MTYQSMTDVAFNLLAKRKRAVEFGKLWDEVSVGMGYSNEIKMRKIAQFYTELSLDTRFASLKDNKWDLRSRHLFNDIHVDLSAILDDDDDESSEQLNEEDESIDFVDEEF